MIPGAPLSRPGRGYIRDRLALHEHDSYVDVPMAKFPEDLRTYEHLLWEGRISTVIELGTWYGGSALWLRDRLVALARYQQMTSRPLVVTVDLNPATPVATLRAQPAITVVEGDVRDPALPDRVAELVHPRARCMVIEDTAHTYETTMAALSGFHRFVAPGACFVVEDGVVDDEALRRPEWPRGVRPAIDAWLRTGEGERFTVRRDLEIYGVTCHPSGFLQRAPLEPVEQAGVQGAP